MYRCCIEKLIDWKNDPYRQPLILNGARQVGKTWLMKEFGEKYFNDYIYINFDNNDDMKNIFSGNITPNHIIRELEIYFQKKITKETLIIFDEVQESPRALSSLKYFAEDAPEYYVICAGSFLGLALHEGTNFPVGKVDFLEIHPMTFIEFLLAFGNEDYVNIIRERKYDYMKDFKNFYIRKLKEYFLVGGMPRVVQIFVETEDYKRVRGEQNKIFQTYKNDFSKHAKSGATPKILDVWQSIPEQLSKENNKFQYKTIKEGSRASDYEYALLWLRDCGLIKIINRISSYKIPIEPYKEKNVFKVFINDIGLLSNMAKISPKTILQGNDIFVEFKGALTEQYVCQELIALKDLNLAYYNKSQCEIDFIGDYENVVFPIEVKANINLRAKSLNLFMEKYKPPFGVRTSLSDYKETENLIDIPLYAISQIINIIEEKV